MTQRRSSRRPASGRVHVTIDTLVLRGFAAGAEGPIARGLRDELAALLGHASNALTPAARSTAVLHCGTCDVTNAAPRRIGTLAARTFMRGFTR